MKIGDILICIDEKGYDNQYYTLNKKYIIYRIADDYIPGKRCGWIKDDYGQNCFFREYEATDKDWQYLKDIRKSKLQKICSSKD